MTPYHVCRVCQRWSCHSLGPRMIGCRLIDTKNLDSKSVQTGDFPNGTVVLSDSNDGLDDNGVYSLLLRGIQQRPDKSHDHPCVCTWLGRTMSAYSRWHVMNFLTSPRVFSRSRITNYLQLSDLKNCFLTESLFTVHHRHGCLDILSFVLFFLSPDLLLIEGEGEFWLNLLGEIFLLFLN